MTYEPEFQIPDEILRPLLATIGNALVERLREFGLTEVGISYDNEEGQAHVTAFFPEYPVPRERRHAIIGRFLEVEMQFFDDVVLILHLETDDRRLTTDGSDHTLTVKAA
jgi:hypothetical protein